MPDVLDRRGAIRVEECPKHHGLVHVRHSHGVLDEAEEFVEGHGDGIGRMGVHKASARVPAVPSLILG